MVLLRLLLIKQILGKKENKEKNRNLLSEKKRVGARACYTFAWDQCDIIYISFKKK